MSYLVVVPELVAAAATDLANIGSSISAANAAAAAPTTALVAAGGDEVSAAIAALFGAHARAYQALSAQAAMFHEQFVRALAAGGNSYAVAEAATAQSVQQDLLNLINAPTQALLGRPLIGNGADGTAANPNGGAVADQRTPPQRLGGRVDQTQHLLFDVGRLGAGIRART